MKTYWTLNVGDTQVSLRDGKKPGTLELILRRDGTETVLRTLAQGTDYSRPEGVSARPFADILSSSGFALHTAWLDGAFSTNDYYALRRGAATRIAETFGWREPYDFTADLNGDGQEELINNSMTGGSGHQSVQVYQRRGNEIWRGRMNLQNLPNHDNRGVNSTATVFDPAQNVFQIRYTLKGQEGYAGLLETQGMERLEFSPHISLPEA